MRLASPLLALAAIAPAYAQLAVTSVTRLPAPDSFADPEFTVPYPGGGALACYADAATDDGAGSVRIVRVDESGVVLWQRNDPIATREGRLDSLRVTPGGSILLNTQNNSEAALEGVLHSIDSDGVLEWSTWPSSVAGGPFVGHVAGFSPSGDIYVIGYTQGDVTFSALLIDASTGDELWRVDRPGVSDMLVPQSILGSSTGSDLFAAYDDGTAYTAIRIDPSGQVVYERSGLGFPYNVGFTGINNGIRTALATADGEFVIGISLIFATGPAPPFQSYLTRLDASGATRWIESTSTASEIAGAVLMDGSDIVVGYRRNGGLLRRIDADGANVWQSTGPPGVRRVDRLTRGPDGSTTVTFLTGPGPGSGNGRQIACYDASGSVRGTLQLESTSSVATSFVFDAAPSVADDRGSSWVTYVSAEPSGASSIARDVAVARVVLDQADESTVCVQSTPNSTGAPGRLTALGSPVADRNDLTLVGEDLPTGQTVLFLAARQGGFTPNPGGSAGDLCLGVPLARYAEDLRTSDSDGRAVLLLDLAATPEGAGTTPVLTGETWFWQAWHREPSGGSHLTSAVSVTFD
ncbi:MAG: hypothetical protein AAFU73_22470 [Planctomycetota bacterium]